MMVLYKSNIIILIKCVQRLYYYTIGTILISFMLIDSDVIHTPSTVIILHKKNSHLYKIEQKICDFSLERFVLPILYF